MNIAMLTNTYLPFIGGVEKSILRFSREFRKSGNKVLIITPEYPDAPEDEPDVVRVPAIQNFNGTDFSVQLPVPGFLSKKLDRFAPDIIHSQHPFLIGDTALRIAAYRALPIVYTFHTYYEKYTHYIPGDSPAMKKFVVSLATGYANLCTHVVAPSMSVKTDLIDRGVTVPISIIPTGIDINKYTRVNWLRFRKREHIPLLAPLAGFVSRIAPEKNIGFLGVSLLHFLRDNPYAHCAIIGDGPSRKSLLDLFRDGGVISRIHAPGSLDGDNLNEAYHAMNCFVFASQTETQGLVLAEAMASGLPVIALKGPGVLDVVDNERNGLIVQGKDERGFAAAIGRFFSFSALKRSAMSASARKKARRFSINECANEMLDLYRSYIYKNHPGKNTGDSLWEKSRRLISAEYELVSNVTSSLLSVVNN